MILLTTKSMVVVVLTLIVSLTILKKKVAVHLIDLIVFTDGYPFGSWGDENYCDTTWIIHGDPEPNPPFGTWAIYDEHKQHSQAA